MNSAVRDTSANESNQSEAKERWGHTGAYAEYQEKANAGADFNASGKRLMEILVEIGKMRDLSPDDARVKDKVRELQEHITANFYTCTSEILAGLGQMYVADERFRNNIDKHGGEGTAKYVNAAIAAYCKSDA